MSTSLFDFETLRVPDGRVSTVTQDGMTVTFRPAARLLRLSGPGMPPQGLVNGGQAQHDEVGHQKPMVIEFTNRLQSRVMVWVGLEDLDLSVSQVEATLRAFDSAGVELGSATELLGRGPTAPTHRLVVDAGMDVIHRVCIEYSGLLRELVSRLEVHAAGDASPVADTVPPVVRILEPFQGQRCVDPLVWVRGEILESGEVVAFELNGTPTPVRRLSESTWEFSGSVALTDTAPRVDAQAVDATGNVGTDSVTVDLRVARVASVSDFRLTQHGVFDGEAVPSRRVAQKTVLVRVMAQLRTSAGQPTSVDSASLELAGAGSSVFFDGYRRPGADGRFTSPGGPYRDGDMTYFFLEGRHLRPGRAYRLVLRLGGRSHQALEQVLATELTFQDVPGLTMLLQPQHRALTAPLIDAMQRTLLETARMYPVRDNVANLADGAPAGVRFALLDPVSYDGHTDPADAGWTRFGEIPYEQGWVLVDHLVSATVGIDLQWATADDPLVLQGGEVLPIEYTRAEDANRDGVLGDQERARVTSGASGRRYDNWNVFARQQATAALLRWNQTRPASQRAQRAIIILTDERDGGQNRTGWAGNASANEPSFWSNIQRLEPPTAGTGDRDGLGAFLPHELGHNLGLLHAEDGVTPAPGQPSPCEIVVEAVNLLTRTLFPRINRPQSPTTPPRRTMCSEVGACEGHFFSVSEYNMLFDLLVTGRRN